MQRDDNEKPTARRNLIGTFGRISALIVAATTSPALAPRARAMNPGPAETRARYRLSDDVKNFYRTNRY